MGPVGFGIGGKQHPLQRLEASITHHKLFHEVPEISVGVQKMTTPMHVTSSRSFMIAASTAAASPAVLSSRGAALLHPAARRVSCAPAEVTAARVAARAWCPAPVRSMMFS